MSPPAIEPACCESFPGALRRRVSFLPLQKLSTRARKDVKVEDITIQVCSVLGCEKDDPQVPHNRWAAVCTERNIKFAIGIAIWQHPIRKAGSRLRSCCLEHSQACPRHALMRCWRPADMQLAPCEAAAQLQPHVSAEPRVPHALATRLRTLLEPCSRCMPCRRCACTRSTACTATERRSSSAP